MLCETGASGDAGGERPFEATCDAREHNEGLHWIGTRKQHDIGIQVILLCVCGRSEIESRLIIIGISFPFLMFFISAVNYIY